MKPAVERHDAILRQAIEEHGGYVFRTEGDAFRAVFATAPQALDAALRAQRAIGIEPWAEEIAPIHVRMALHTGAVEIHDGDYVGPSLNRMARLLSTAYGGQTVLSLAAEQLVRDSLPADVALKDLGEHRLKDLIRSEHIFQLVVPDLPADFPPLRTLDNLPNNLPRQSTALIDREKETATICSLLRRPETTLVTLKGPAGTGKSRLALQAGAEILEEFESGVWFVELAALTDPQLVIPGVAAVLGVKEAGGQPLAANLIEYLRERRILLILDNFEQVVGAAEEISKLLATCPHLRIPATSRLPLRIKGEKEYPVPPLGLPPLEAQHAASANADRLSQYDAVRLFIERAQDINPNFRVTNDNAPAVAEICVRLDGLPLAIELAAARIRLFPPHALLSRLSSRLKVLTGGARDLPARQQTLRGAIEWSYDLLNEGEKQFFARMAVFQGGRTFDALETVCTYDGKLKIDILEGVESLVEKNLLQQREGSDGEPRFWMLETIHEYAREKMDEIGEARALKESHAQYFLSLAKEATKHWRSSEEGAWLDRLDEEHDNLRAALNWAASPETGMSARPDSLARVKIGLELVTQVDYFWYIRGYVAEGRERAAVAISAAGALELGGDTQGDEATVSKEIDLLKARAHLAAGNLAWQQGDHEAAHRHLEIARSTVEERHDDELMAQVLSRLEVVAINEGHYAQAVEFATQALNIYRRRGDKRGIAGALHNLGIAVQHQGDWAKGNEFLSEGLATWRELGIRLGLAYALIHLGNGALEQRKLAEAGRMYRECLPILQEFKDRRAINEGLEGLACVAQAEGRPERAALLFGAAEATRQSAAVKLGSYDQGRHDTTAAAARAALGGEALERSWKAGSEMSTEAAVSYALDEN